jgi:hypothetical protein
VKKSAPSSKSLQRLVTASAVFDADDYAKVADEGEAGLDPAARRAILRQAALVTVFREVKRRDREAAAFETGRSVLDGYNTVRYALGTWNVEVSYSAPRTAEANAKRLSDRMDYFPAIETLMPSLSPALRRFLTGLAVGNASGSILETLFGVKKAEGLALTALVDGIYIGLAEADEFL